MKVGIIGGGISGLYLGYKLTLLGHTVCIFESSSHLGGRIHTIHTDGEVFEAGAGRFNTNHKRLYRLLRVLNLQDKIQPIKSERSFMINSNKYDYDKYEGTMLFKKVVTASKTQNVDFLKGITLKDYMSSIIGISNTQRVIEAFGYNSEFELQNAHTSLEIFKTDFNDAIQYFYLKGGLFQVIERLRDKILSYNDNRIRTTSQVYDYDPKTNKVYWKSAQRQSSEKFDKVVFCVTKQALLSLNGLMKHDNELVQFLTQSIEMAPLHRIFVKFPVSDNGSAWFQGINRVTTNLPIRYIIPMNQATGLIQISYTDKQFADYWNSFDNDEDVVRALMNNLNILFPKRHIPKPLWIKRCYWKEGATYWKPNFKTYKQRLGCDYHIAGEITSKRHNAWIEGGLESADRVLKTINRKH